MTSSRLISLAIILLAAGVAAAQPPDNWRDYFEGPAGYLVTKKERKDWKKVDTAAQAEQFIDLFWAKRDPDLKTPLNEFKEEFDLRVKAADGNFGNHRERGAMTDRGKVLILLGRPAQREEKGPEAPADDEPGGMGSTGGAAPTFGLETMGGGGAMEAWVYDPATLPPGIKEDQPLTVVFQETRPGSGDFLLLRSDPRSGVALHVLEEVPRALLLHPDLEEIPHYGLIQGTQPATAAELAWFAAATPAAPQPAAVLTKEGLVSASHHFIWTHLELASGPQQVLAVGRLRNQTSGETVGSFQLAVDALDVPRGRAYELSVPVAPGTWALDLALAQDGSPLAVTTVELETTDVPMDRTVFAPFLWGAQVVQHKDPTISDPFSIGGWHVIPRTDDTYTSTETIDYMLYVLQPKLGEDGKPQLTFRVVLSQSGHRLVESPPQPAQMSRVAAGLWMYGGGIELSKIPRAGDYSVEIQLTQATDGAETAVTIPITLVKPESGEQP